MTEVQRHFEFMSLKSNVDFYKQLNKNAKDKFISEGLVTREFEVNNTLKEFLPSYKNIVANNMKLLGIPNYKEASKLYLEKHLYKNPVLFTYDYLNFTTNDFEHFYKSEELIQSIDSNEGLIINAFHTDLFQTLPFLIVGFLKSIESNKKLYVVGPEQSLSILKDADINIHGGINKLNYMYIDDLNDQPYPLLLKNCLEILKNGDILYILPEISFGFNTIFTTKFFNQEVKLPMGSAYLSQKLEIPIIFMYSIVEDKTNKNIIFVTQPNYPAQYLGSFKENIYNQSKDVFVELEKVVNKYPASWIGFESFDYMRPSNE